MKGVFLSSHTPILTLRPSRQKLLPVSHMFTGYFWQDMLTCALHSPGLAARWKACVHLHSADTPDQTSHAILLYYYPLGQSAAPQSCLLHCPRNLRVPMTIPINAMVSGLQPV